MFRILTGIILVVFLAAGCNKDKPAPKPVAPPPVNPNPAPVAGKQGSVTVEFVNRIGAAELVLSQSYKLQDPGDSITVTKFNYYISNVVLVSDVGNFVQPESYFVVKHPDTRQFMLTSVSAGTYTAIRFLIGVDSTRNCSGAQTGGLDLGANGDMYWSWSSGYIFMKLEARSPKAGSTNKTITYHVGGFKGENKAQRSVEVGFGNTPLIINQNEAHVKIAADVATVVGGLDFSTFYNMMSPGAGAKKIADNYARMCTLESIKN